MQVYKDKLAASEKKQQALALRAAAEKAEEGPSRPVKEATSSPRSKSKDSKEGNKAFTEVGVQVNLFPSSQGPDESASSFSQKGEKQLLTGKNEKFGKPQGSPKHNEKYLSEMRKNAEEKQNAPNTQKLMMKKAGVAQN